MVTVTQLHARASERAKSASESRLRARTDTFGANTTHTCMKGTVMFTGFRSSRHEIALSAEYGKGAHAHVDNGSCNRTRH